MFNKHSIALLTVLALSACGVPIKQALFASSRSTPDVLNTAARVLATEGQSVANRDDTSGVLDTTWVETGLMWGSNSQGQTRMLVRRYKLVVSPAASGSTVVLRLDVKGCPAGGYTVGGSEVRGICDQITQVPETLQQDADAMAARIDMALQKSQ